MEMLKFQRRVKVKLDFQNLKNHTEKLRMMMQLMMMIRFLERSFFSKLPREKLYVNRKRPMLKLLRLRLMESKSKIKLKLVFLQEYLLV